MAVAHARRFLIPFPRGLACLTAATRRPRCSGLPRHSLQRHKSLCVWCSGQQRVSDLLLLHCMLHMAVPKLPISILTVAILPVPLQCGWRRGSPSMRFPGQWASGPLPRRQKRLDRHPSSRKATSRFHFPSRLQIPFLNALLKVGLDHFVEPSALHAWVGLAMTPWKT